MSSDNNNVFSKDNLNMYLNELSKAYKKLGGKNMPAEIILIGGAAIIENYGFRDMTTDVDAIISAASVMKEAIANVGDKYGLPNGWLNSDFMKTSSYSKKLRDYSKHYKTFNQVLDVRTVDSEYLIAMKLKSGRKYKNDLSDIIGIFAEHKKRGDNISYDRINAAVINLYGSWDDFSVDSLAFIKNALANGDYEKIYISVRENERETKDTLVEFQEQYPDRLKESNVEDVLNSLKAKRTDN